MSVPPFEALKVAGLIGLFGDYLILPRVWAYIHFIDVA